MKLKFRQYSILAAMAAVCGLVLAGCGGAKIEQKYPIKQRNKWYQNEKDAPVKGKLFGGDAGILKGKKKGDGGGGIGVNGYLWRASLDTVSFMPLKSADPFGGVIITDWYIADATPNERLKITVYILDRRLRADAVRVSVFKQRKRGSSWRDAAVSSQTARKLENQILTRARELRISHLD